MRFRVPLLVSAMVGLVPLAATTLRSSTAEAASPQTVLVSIDAAGTAGGDRL